MSKVYVVTSTDCVDHEDDEGSTHVVAVYSNEKAAMKGAKIAAIDSVGGEIDAWQDCEKEENEDGWAMRVRYDDVDHIDIRVDEHVMYDDAPRTDEYNDGDDDNDSEDDDDAEAGEDSNDKDQPPPSKKQRT